jgi:tetratricopeptide (TPR) repeat protein
LYWFARRILLRPSLGSREASLVSEAAEGRAMALATEAVRLASVDPQRAEGLATRSLAAARAEGDLAAESRARRALGLSSAQRTGVDDAVSHLRHAVRLAVRTGSPGLEGEARMTLGGALSYRGSAEAALRELDRAVALLEGISRAHAIATRGLVMFAAGRLPQALESFRIALDPLRAARDDEWVLAVLLNRGACHLSHADLHAAEADLSEAAELAERIGFTVQGGYALANLALVHTLQGRVVDALTTFGSAEMAIRSTGAHVAALLSMRAELLVSARLLSEARSVASEALQEFQREADARGAAETDLLMAQVAFLDGDPTAATIHARRAATALRRLGRDDLATLARFWLLRARDAGASRRPPAAKMVQIIERLTEAGWHGVAVEARIVAHRSAGRQGVRALDGVLDAAARRRLRGPAALRARGWYAEAMSRLDAGRPVAAERAALRGLQVLDEHRASLPATDLRVHAAGHRTDLVELGLGVAVAAGSARRSFVWAERGRATHLLQRPVRPPSDSGLADGLAALRSVVRELYEARSTGASTSAQERLRHRQVILEREIRDLAREAGGDHFDPVGRPADLRDLGTALGARALVEYAVLDGALHAVTLVDNRCRLHHLGDVSVVAGLLERVPFAVQRMIRAARSPGGAAAATTLLADAGRRLDDVLLAPLRETAGRELVVVPTGILQALPWSVLPSCRGRALTVSPSATVWLAATRRPAGPGHAVVAAGPRLPSAPAEAKAVAELYGTQALVDPDARVDTVMASLAGAAVAHLATHGRLSAENPLFSHLLLSDGPLVVYDLERLKSLPHTVVLAACDSGRHVVRAGDELLGLGAAFLAGGTAQLVASVVPVPDAETASLMTALHTGLSIGTPPAVALAQAQAAVAGSGAVAEATAAGFVCIGAGFVPVPFTTAAGPPAADGAGATGHQPRARQVGSEPRSAPIVVSLP